VPKPQNEHSSNAARTLTIAGYSLQFAGIGGLATAAVLGVENRGGTPAASNAFAVGGAIAILGGTLMAASGSPLTFGPPPSGFIELR
jgi:hypothetical protein